MTALTIKHAFVSQVADSPQDTLVRPSDWNADLEYTGVLPVENGGTGGNGGVTEKANTYTIIASDVTIKTTGSSSFTVTLPTAVGITGKEYNLKHVGSGVITLKADGTELIDDLACTVVNAGIPGAYPNRVVKSDGVGWMIV